VLALGVLGVFTLVMFWHRFVFDNWLARHDLLTFFLPWLGALGDRLRDLDIPALNPYIFSGAPFAGDPESGWMYIPAMLVFPFFEVTLAYKLMILLLLVIAGSSTYALARLVGYGVLAALISAVAFEFGPFLYGHRRHQDLHIHSRGASRRRACPAGPILAHAPGRLGAWWLRHQPDARRVARARGRQRADPRRRVGCLPDAHHAAR
jgi:hypothetical protein